ncbi:MAG: cation:proton antiporter [Candidatus Methylacidiphilales bacterium]
MTGLSLIQDFAVMLVLAAMAGWGARRLGLSAVVGYLLAGLIVGPYTPPFAFVVEPDRVQTLSQLGLVFLMFFVGMRLSLRRIRSLGLGLVVATGLGAWMIFMLCQGLAGALGWEGRQGVFLGAMLMVSSSAIISKVLEETGSLNDRFAQKAQGVTVLEDVVAIVMLALLTPRGAEAGAVGHTVGLLFAFAALLVVVGLLFLPKVLARYATSGDRDLKAVLVSGIVCAAAVLASSAGFSVALGAFLIGVVLGETLFRARIERALTGTQDLFSAIFFVSIGMLINPHTLLAEWKLILGLSVFAIVVRVVGPSLALWLTGTRLRTAFMAGLALVPVGEFSYIIAGQGVAAGVLPERFYAIAVGISLVTAVAAPVLTRSAERVADGFIRLQPGLVLALAEAYAGWLGTVQQRLESRIWWKLTRGRLGQVAVELLLMAALLAYSVPAANALGDFLDRAGMVVPGWEWAFGILVMLGVTAMAVAAWRNLAALSMIYAEVFAGSEGNARRFRPVVEGALQLVSAALLLWLIWLFWPDAPGAQVILTVLLVAAIALTAIFWRRLISWHSHFMISLQSAMGQGGQKRWKSGAVLGEGTDAWKVEIQGCTIPEMGMCRGKTLAELNLRARFGCTVVEIERQGTLVPNPRPEMTLFAGDRLLLFGTEEQIRGGRAFLMKESPEADQEDLSETALETVVVPADCPYVGKTLVELAIFQMTGVQIVGILRDGVKRLNPAGTETIQTEDELLILGDPEDLAGFKRWLLGPQPKGKQ